MAKTCREALLAVIGNEFLTYNQICNIMRYYPYNYGTVERNIRWLVEDGVLESIVEKVQFADRTKNFKKFRLKGVN
jgi:hypothetical protein